LGGACDARYESHERYHQEQARRSAETILATLKTAVATAVTHILFLPDRIDFVTGAGLSYAEQRL
jgi:hypothetical protein